MSKKDAFFTEIFNPKEIDFKGNQISKENGKNFRFHLLSEVPVEQWSDKFSKTVYKIASLCGFSASDIYSNSFTSSIEITASLQHKEPKIILCFLSEEQLNQLHFQRNRKGFTHIKNHKIIFLPLNEIFLTHQKSKQLLWQAMQEEFPNMSV